MPLKSETYLSRLFKHGLGDVEVQQQTRLFGKNELIGKPPPTDLQFLFSQFKNPLVAILVIAGLITFLLKEYTDTIVIFLAVFINTILGFIQERRAFKSLESLKQVITPQAWVIRNNKRQQIDARLLVPGDIVELYEGDKIPGDGIVTESNDLLLNEAIVTGESYPVKKDPYQFPDLKQIPELIAFFHKLHTQLDSSSQEMASQQVLMGTIVTGGSGKILISRTGMMTEIGKIATHISEHADEDTPLEQRLKNLAKFLTVGIICMSIGVFFFGLTTGQDLTEMFAVSVALAVSAIPEGLVVALTAILAIGMHRILKRKALVRSLAAAETLGSVTCVCVDKTGTLTEGILQVVATEFTNLKLAYKISTLANDLRDPLEIARWQWAKQLCETDKSLPKPDALLEDNPRDDAIPFSSQIQFLATRHGNTIYLVGAPEKLLSWSKLTKAQKVIQMDTINAWGEKGQRMIGLASATLPTTTQAKLLFDKIKHHTIVHPDLNWVGLMGFKDPIRESVKSAIAKTQRAGVEVKVITGDFRNTAVAVLKDIGIELEEDEIIEGYELEKFSPKQLQAIVGGIKLFARTKPSQKLYIVEALKANGEVVGMMGDGVNDAPALAAADIGMVVGSASEVARETSDMVLLNSNFKTILAAIEEGRGIFDNLRKVILYLLSDTFSEIIVVIGCLFLGLPVAVTAAQILWINLVDDSLPNLALIIDPKAKDLLERKPIKLSEQLINGQMRALILLASVISGGVSLYIYQQLIPQLGVEHARTIVFAILSIDSLFYVFSCRSLTKNIWQESLFKNPWLILASLGGAILTIAPIYIPGLQLLLKLSPLTPSDWILVIAVSFLEIVVIELVKYIANKLRK